MKVRKGNITTMKVDAIVNAANSELLMGGGVCGAIFNAAGAKELQRACDKLAPVDTGSAAITPGYNLPAKYVIHAVGPIYNPTRPSKSKRLLASAYISALKLATEHNIKSVAFPLISAGIYGFPKDEAMRIAKETIEAYEKEHDIEVTLMLYEK